MAWETVTNPNAGGGDFEDRDKVKFGIGLKLEGTVVRVSDRKTSKFGGDVRYVDIDTTDGRKVTIGVSGRRLDYDFEHVGYQPGDGIRVEVTEQKTDNDVTYGRADFQINKGAGSAAPKAAVPVGGGAGSPAFDDSPPF